MRIRFTVFILILNFYFSAFGQNWKFNQSNGDNVFYFSVSELSNGKYFVTGFKVDSTQNVRSGSILILNNQGQLVKQNTLTLGGFHVTIVRLINETVGGNFLVLGAISDTIQANSGYFPTVFTLDSGLQIISLKKYNFPLQNYLRSMNTNKVENDNLLVFGETQNDTAFAHYLYVFNSIGDSINATLFNGYQALEINDCIKNKSNGDYKLITTGASYFSRGNVFALDSTLHFKYLDSLNSSSYTVYLEGFFTAKNYNDSCFLLSGQYSTINNNSEDILISKYNSRTNSLIIQKHYGKINIYDQPVHYRGMDFINKNNIYLGGTDNYFYAYSSIPSWLMINNLDSNLNLRWVRYIGGDAEYIMSSVTATSDGGCLLNATRYDSLTATFPFQRDVVIIKLDSLGTVTGTSDGSKIKVSKYLLYPNPAQNLVTISGYIEHSILIELFDAMGKCALSKKINTYSNRIDIENLHAGMYYYKITDGTYSESGKWMKE